MIYYDKQCTVEIASPAFGGLAMTKIGIIGSTMTNKNYFTIQNLAFGFYHLFVICNLKFRI